MRLDAIVSRSPVLMLLRVTVIHGRHVTATQRTTQSLGHSLLYNFILKIIPITIRKQNQLFLEFRCTHCTLPSLSCVAGWYRLRFLCSVAPLVLHFIESHLEGHVIIDGMRNDGYDYVVAAACEHVGENE